MAKKLKGDTIMADDSSSSENVQEAPVNCWQYSRDVYLVGRSLKFRPFTDEERAAVIEFITAMAETRPAYVPYINIKADNPPANEFEEQSSSSEQEGRELVWTLLEKQNDHSLAKMVQKIGRSLKIQFCTAEEKGLCDALFESTDQRRFQTLNKYADAEVAEESSASEEESSSEPEQSSSEPEQSSSEPEQSSASSEG